MNRYSLEEFIEKSKRIHNNKYDYSLVEYINTKTKVKIVCHSHGVFLQTPYSHLRGQGCPKCASENSFLTKEQFIEKAIQIHGNRYDYSLVNYINNKIKVKIICPEHGLFYQKPLSHLIGQKCIYCAKRKLTNQEFVEKAMEIHGNKYDYSKVELKNVRTKIEIICSKHGSFFQVPYYHLSGNGCPLCGSSKGELKISKFLNKNNIIYKYEYIIKSCKNLRVLPFDFAIFDNNNKLLFLIEYDGEFHYKPIFGEDVLNETQYRDKIKTDYCADNNIKLVRIDYSQYNDIEKILGENLAIYDEYNSKKA